MSRPSDALTTVRLLDLADSLERAKAHRVRVRLAGGGEWVRVEAGRVVGRYLRGRRHWRAARVAELDLPALARLVDAAVDAVVGDGGPEAA